MNQALSDTPAPAWDRIRGAIDSHQRFLITTHVNPDGDGLGAELGLCAYLVSRGKDVVILNPDPLSDRYAFLAEHATYLAYDASRDAEVIEQAEVIIVLDISRWERLGELGKRLRSCSALKICIDHHPFEANGMADIYGVDLTAAATGQLVYEMIRDGRQAVDVRMAMGFYISILTDTGSFRFSNSDPRAHRVAAELIETGLDPNELYERVYGDSSLSRLRLLGYGLSHMRMEAEGRLAFVVLPREAVRECGAVPADTEGFVDVARTARGTEGVALLFEHEEGTIKVSLRSRGRINVNRVASALGGGGHVLASGATMDGPLGTAVTRLRDLLERELALLDHAGERSAR